MVKKGVLILMLVILLVGFFSASESYPETYSEQIEIAKSHYPELDNISIEFIEKPINKRMMVSRPKLNFLFEKNREYRIIFNNDPLKNRDYLLTNVSFKGQVGLIGHEIAHIVDYENKSRGEIVWIGIAYSSNSFKKKLERKIDEIAIAHGMYEEIYEFNSFVLEDENSPQEYKDYRREIYYTPEELRVLG